MTVNTSAHSNRLINMHMRWYETEGEQVRFKSKLTVDHDIKRDLKTFLASLLRQGVFLQLSFNIRWLLNRRLRRGEGAWLNFWNYVRTPEWLKFRGKPFIFSSYLRDKVAYFIKVLVRRFLGGSHEIPAAGGDRVLSSYLCNYFGTN